jgi:peptidoglycan/xylan/chitin deacetylase (PgdA/CDA1 family)
MPRRWTPSATLKASLAVHGGAALGLLASPGHWPWALGALAANHAVLTTAGLLPRSQLLGPTLTRLPPAAAAQGQITLTFDDGPDPEVTPRALDLLDAAGVRASFFCIGWRARKHPALCREIAERGHQVENHGDAHSNVFSLFGPGRMRADISAAQATLADITGRAPRFFRATAGLRNPFLDPVLARLDLHLAAWTRRAYDTRCADPDTVYRRLVHRLGPGDILLMHDGNARRDADGQPVILTVLPRILARLAEYPLTAMPLGDACP